MPRSNASKKQDAAIIRAFMRPHCDADSALKDFLRLRAAEPTLGRSNIGSCAVDYGTFEQRFRTRRQGKSGSPLEYCRKPRNMRALRLRSTESGRPLSDFTGLYCGLVASFRPMTAKWLISRFGARRVLDPCAGWGGRMLGAMSLDAHYIGIDSNVDLRPCYDRLLKLLEPHSDSKVRMLYRPSETVDFSTLPVYDCICTSPPYDDLEHYPHAPRYDDFRTGFILPVLKRAFDAMLPGGWMCINVPDALGDLCVSVFGVATEVHKRALVGRWPGITANKTESIYCWKKIPTPPPQKSTKKKHCK
jgi:hypothetical protein